MAGSETEVAEYDRRLAEWDRAARDPANPWRPCVPLTAEERRELAGLVRQGTYLLVDLLAARRGCLTPEGRPGPGYHAAWQAIAWALCLQDLCGMALQIEHNPEEAVRRLLWGVPAPEEA